MNVIWISDYPLEWMGDEAPAAVRNLPRHHFASWMPVLREELELDTSINLHVVALRKGIDRDISFQAGRTRFHVLKTRGGFRSPTFFWTDTLLIRRFLKTVRADMVHAWGTERGEAAVASRLGLPYLVTIQGLLGWYRELVPLNLHERFACMVENYSLRRAKFVTTESRFAVQYLHNKYPRLRVIQAEHASNWVFHRIARHPQTAPVRFLSVGTVGHRKGSDLLFKAFNKLTSEFPFELIVVGSPKSEYFEQLRRELSDDLMKRVTFRTGLSAADIAGELSKATISLLPTRADTSPNAVKEAVVAGVPVIATTIGGIPDYVQDGKNGLLIDSGNLEQFVDAIRRGVKHSLFGKGLVDPDYHKQVREYLEPRQMARLFKKAYETVLAGEARD